VRRKTWKRAELPGNLKRVRDGPYLPFEEVLGAERNGIAFVPGVPFRWEHQGIRRGVWTNLAPSFDVGADALRNGDTDTPTLVFTFPSYRSFPELGAYFVTGNHEKFSDTLKYLDAVSRTGAKEKELSHDYPRKDCQRISKNQFLAHRPGPGVV
jgi:hypothetical protein